MQRVIRIGVAGLGRIGMLHAENIAGRLLAVELAHVVDPVERVARAAGERLGAKWSTSYQELLANPDVDGVVIASPTTLHAEMIEGAAGHEKHVFCEKPLSLRYEDSAHAVAFARDAGVKLQVGFHRRFDPDWAAALERIRSGELGDVYLYRTSLREMNPPNMSYIEESGGLFVDGTIHELDEARWMVGEIEEVSAFGSARSDPAFAKMRDVDTALVFLRFVNGAIGVIDTSRVAGYGWEASTEVMGSGATLRIARHRRTHVDWLRPGTVASDWVGSFIESHAEAYLLEMEAFAAAIRDDVTPAATGEDALAAFVLAEACTTSFRDARRVRLEISDSPYGPRYAVADATRTTQ